MNHSQKRKKRKNGQPEPPVPMSLKEKLQLWARIVGCLIVVGAGVHLITTQEQTISLDRQMQCWRSDYHLNDEQASRIRIMEEIFHGSGNPFLSPEHTREEIKDHHRAMAAVMNRDDGVRFYHAQEGMNLSR